MSEIIICSITAKSVLWHIWFLTLEGFNLTHERSSHAKGEVCRPNNLWVMGQPLICGVTANSVLWQRFWYIQVENSLVIMFCVGDYFSGAHGWSEVLKCGFGLNRGQLTSSWPKIKINAQKILPCKISVQSVHWGPFYGTPMVEFAHFALPLFLDLWITFW